MKYMVLIYSNEAAWTPEERTACIAESTELCHELHSKHEFLGASPLHPVATATSVRIREGRRLVTTGPFAETTEQLGGYFLIDVPNLDAAIAVAGRIPSAKKGTVEIRPVLELPILPADKCHLPKEGYQRVLLLCYDDEQYWDSVGKEAHQAAMKQAVEHTHQLDAAGQYLTASPLHPVSTATSVRVSNGKRIVTDGPFAETREVLGGFYLLYVKDLDEAVEIAANHPGAPVGTVEIRGVPDVPSLPTGSDREIVSTREFPFSRDQIFEAFRDPERLARWWGPDGFTNTFEVFDFQPEGNWKFIMHGPDGTDYNNHSVFETVTPDLIVLNHISPPRFRMTIWMGEFAPNRTRIVWRMQFETAALRNEIAKFAIPCNEQNFDRLTKQLQSESLVLQS